MEWKDWARLVRIPTVFTIVADVSAAFLLTAAGPQPVSRWICIVLAGICLYWAGMIFNDVFDLEQDRRERPGRPLPAGKISMKSAIMAGGVLILVGLGMAILSGLVPATMPGGDLELAATWRPAVVAGILAVMVLLYDGPLKNTPLGPVAMGSCRVLSFLLGASPVLLGELPEWWFPKHVWGAAIGMGVYVMGVTLIARREAGETRRGTLVVGLVVLVLGCICMAISPRLAEAGIGFRVRGDDGFALLIGMLGFTVVFRAAKLFSDPSPARVQATVKIALLSLIAFASAFALLGAGPVWGLAIFALVFPATFLSARFRMT